MVCIQGSWKLQLCQKLKNMRQPSEKQSKNDDSNQKENEEDDQENIENYDLTNDESNSSEDSRDSIEEDELMKDDLMEDELQKLDAELQKNPNKKFVKKAMDTIFLQRRRWIQEECPSLQDILFKYPIFKNAKYVSSYTYIFSYYIFM